MKLNEDEGDKKKRMTLTMLLHSQLSIDKFILDIKVHTI